MKMDSQTIAALIASFFIGLWIGAAAMFITQKTFYHDTAIAHQCAHYDSKTGAFTWTYEEISP